MQASLGFTTMNSLHSFCCGFVLMSTVTPDHGRDQQPDQAPCTDLGQSSQFWRCMHGAGCLNRHGDSMRPHTRGAHVMTVTCAKFQGQSLTFAVQIILVQIYGEALALTWHT